MLNLIAPFIIKRLLAKQNRKPSLVHGDSIRSIAVIANKESGQYHVTENYVKQLRHRGIKTVDYYVFFPNQKIQDLNAAKLKCFPFNPKSLGLFGNFKTPELDHYKEVEYDVLIDLSEPDVLECELLVASIDAKWKAGKGSKSKYRLLDFMIETKDNDMRSLIHHLDSYLMNFNKMNAA
jgi:hypothetical protein